MSTDTEGTHNANGGFDVVSYKQLAERGFGIARRGARGLSRIARYGAGAGAGLTRRATSPLRGPKHGMDDVTLARKVESQIFREAGAPKGKVSVNAVDGVVELRGEVKTPDLINELERRTKQVPEVRGVENLLHLPKTPARRRTTRAAGGKAPRREPRRMSADKERADAEPRPDEAAAKGEGRKAAPLGSTREGGEQR